MNDLIEETRITAGSGLGEVFTLVGKREGGILEEVVELRIGADVFDIDRCAMRVALDILERTEES